LGNGNAAHGCVRTIILFAVLAFVFLIISFLSTKERIQPPPHQSMSIKEDVRETFTNTPWRVLFVLVLCVFIAIAMFGSSANFYFQSYLDQNTLQQFLGNFGFNISKNEAYTVGFSLFNTLNAVVQFMGVLFLSELLANRFGKKTTFTVGLALCTIFTALFYLPSPRDVGMVYALCLLKSLSYGPTIPLMWAMIADAADHMEYINHRRATGFCFSGIIFALKSGMGIGGAIAGLILSIFGYMSGIGNTQSETAVWGIRLVTSLVPALLFTMGVVVMYFYPITKSYNEKMQAELAHRRKMSASLNDK
jgi:GPH family glycoside/pentoside/hexuronide:cation symporter